MLTKLNSTLGLLFILLSFLSCCYGEDTNNLQLSRSKRDTAKWDRTTTPPLLQDFQNGTTYNTTSNIWKECSCDRSGCDCYSQYLDFNATKLIFRIEHINSLTRFQVSFRDQNRTIQQTFSLVNGTSCFKFRKTYFDQVCFLRYGQEANTILDKACLALGVRIQKYSAIAADFECIKYMADGTTHVGPLNISQPDLLFLTNFTLYGAANANNVSSLLLVISLITAVLISRTEN